MIRLVLVFAISSTFWAVSPSVSFAINGGSCDASGQTSECNQHDYENGGSGPSGEHDSDGGGGSEPRNGGGSSNGGDDPGAN
jgi:hypothetical protein